MRILLKGIYVIFALVCALLLASLFSYMFVSDEYGNIDVDIFNILFFILFFCIISFVVLNIGYKYIVKDPIENYTIGLKTKQLKGICREKRNKVYIDDVDIVKLFKGLNYKNISIIIYVKG